MSPESLARGTGSLLLGEPAVCIARILLHYLNFCALSVDIVDFFQS